MRKYKIYPENKKKTLPKVGHFGTPPEAWPVAVVLIAKSAHFLLSKVVKVVRMGKSPDHVIRRARDSRMARSLIHGVSI